MATILSLQNLCKSYTGKTGAVTRVLDQVSLDVEEGEFIAILGFSGAGKTTLVSAIAGLIEPDAGQILLRGAPIDGQGKDRGLVFQSYSLFPHLRALENTAFGLRRRGVGRAEATRRAGDGLELVGLGHLADRYPHQLSGGQQQRVALARALVTEPRVLLLDEPLSALDAQVRVQLRDEIRRLQLRLGTTTVFVTHDQEEALAVSDRVAVMGAGRILQIGTPEDLYLRPATAEVAAFVGASSLVPGIVSARNVEVWGRELPLLGDAHDGHCEVFVRPENVQFVGEADAGVDGIVQESTFLGSVRRTMVRATDGSIVQVQHGTDERLVAGDRVRIRLAAVPVVTRPVG